MPFFANIGTRIDSLLSRKPTTRTKASDRTIEQDMANAVAVFSGGMASSTSWSTPLKHTEVMKPIAVVPIPKTETMPTSTPKRTRLRVTKKEIKQIENLLSKTGARTIKSFALLGKQVGRSEHTVRRIAIKFDARNARAAQRAEENANASRSSTPYRIKVTRETVDAVMRAYAASPDATKHQVAEWVGIAQTYVSKILAKNCTLVNRDVRTKRMEKNPLAGV